MVYIRVPVWFRPLNKFYAPKTYAFCLYVLHFIGFQNGIVDTMFQKTSFSPAYVHVSSHCILYFIGSNKYCTFHVFHVRKWYHFRCTYNFIWLMESSIVYDMVFPHFITNFQIYLRSIEWSCMTVSVLNCGLIKVAPSSCEICEINKH